MTTQISNTSAILDPGYLVIQEDGRTSVICCSHLSVDTMHTVLGSRFDCVRLAAGLDMWVRDEGKFDSNYNPYASAIFRTYLGHYDVVYGPVIVCGVDASLDNAPLPAASLRFLIAAAFSDDAGPRGFQLPTVPSRSLSPGDGIRAKAAALGISCVLCHVPVTNPMHADEGPPRLYCDACSGCAKLSPDDRCDACYCDALEAAK